MLDLHFSTIKNGSVEHDGRGEELAPRKHRLQIGSTDQVVQIALRVHSRHVEDQIFFVFALGDVYGCSWHFRGRSVEFGEGVEQRGLSGIGEAD